MSSAGCGTDRCSASPITAASRTPFSAWSRSAGSWSGSCTWWRIRGRKTNIPDLPPRWGMLFGFAYIAGLSHILLDYTNNYGVRPFWPFWEKWYSWDIVFIAEPLLWLALTAGLV